MCKTEGQILNLCPRAPQRIDPQRTGVYTPVPVSSLGWEGTEESKKIGQSANGGKTFILFISWFIVFFNNFFVWGFLFVWDFCLFGCIFYSFIRRLHRPDKARPLYLLGWDLWFFLWLNPNQHILPRRMGSCPFWSVLVSCCARRDTKFLLQRIAGACLELKCPRTLLMLW